ncbi:MAG: phosphatase PAP2 family protein [Cryobacterium sp.]|uniref:phosphatase PAP2 family protein n=1 Tax=Cryobacterium sp. TaxID=1926290 RepID=UPI00228939D3|nr:phosphatase PAP2 family protein [Cryobacterium sp.]MCY7405229.1 phosphatase PAP2 family protein [Cryobacterium sp.]
MGTDIRPRILFARTAIPAVGVILAVIVSGLVLKSSAGWTSMEMDVLRQVNSAHTPQLDWVALGIDWLFESAVATILVLLGTGSILLATRRPHAAIRFLLIVVIPTLGADAIKLLVHRARPDIPSLSHVLVLEPGGLSFPSGHTSFAACFFLGFIVATAGQRWRPFLIAAAAVVVLGTAASRVYLGVHYPSDVAASIVYSIAAVTLVEAAWLLVMSDWNERRSGLHAGPANGGASDAR